MRVVCEVSLVGRVEGADTFSCSMQCTTLQGASGRLRMPAILCLVIVF